MSKRVLVTGANGHVGSNLVKHLIESGYSVRASVRNPDDARNSELKKLDVDIVQADLFDSASLETACENIDGLFQVAAVYDLKPSTSDEASNMIDTGITGTANVLTAASKAGVKRVVLTSSVVTIGPVASNMPPANETSWITDFSIPYVTEKTRGEQKAWEIANNLNLDLVSILPAAILGPGFSRPTPSTDFIEAFAKGSVRFGVPDIDFPVVDVRDVARIHRLAYETGEPGARYIAMKGQYSAYEVACSVCRAYDAVGRPLLKIPRLMTGFVPAMDSMMASLRNYPHTYTSTLHRSWFGRDWRVDDSNTRQALGFQPEIGLDQAVADTIGQLRSIGRL